MSWALSLYNYLRIGQIYYKNNTNLIPVHRSLQGLIERHGAIWLAPIVIPMQGSAAHGAKMEVHTEPLMATRAVIAKLPWLPDLQRIGVNALPAYLDCPSLHVGCVAVLVEYMLCRLGTGMYKPGQNAQAYRQAALHFIPEPLLQVYWLPQHTHGLL